MRVGSYSCFKFDTSSLICVPKASASIRMVEVTVLSEASSFLNRRVTSFFNSDDAALNKYACYRNVKTLISMTAKYLGRVG